MSKKRWILATGGALWVLALLGYLAVMPVPTSMVSGLVDGLEVTGQAAARGGPAHFASDGRTATIQLGNQTARVTSHEIEVIGGRTIPIPAACKHLRLFETQNDIRILFEGDEPTLRFTTGAFALAELLFGFGIITALAILVRPALLQSGLGVKNVFRKKNLRLIGLSSILALALVVVMWSASRIPELTYPPRALVLTFLGYTNTTSGVRIAKFHVENVGEHAVLRSRHVILDNVSLPNPYWLLKLLGRGGGSVQLGASRRLARGQSEEIAIPLPKGDWWWKITVQFENDSKLRTAREWLSPRGFWPNFMDRFVPPLTNQSVTSQAYETKDAAPNPLNDQSPN